ncbi:hypothetical protein JW905_19330, partial [bacterium]|nr:hypothetical protein [candidate division CSSED10-310 bacterium]
MKRLVDIIYLIGIACAWCLVPIAGIGAAWSTDPVNNTRVHPTQINQDDQRIIPLSDGGYMLAWIFGEGGLMVQKFDSNGDRQWGTGGIEIRPDGSDVEVPSICDAGAGGGFIFWREPGAGTREVHGQRISVAGVQQWGVGGVLVSSAGIDGECMFVVDDEQGGAYVAWMEEGVKGAKGEGIYCQRVSAAGAGFWPVPLHVSGTEGFSPKVEKDGAGGLLLAWVESDPVYEENVYSQRIAPDGTLLWGAGGVMVSGLLAEYKGCPRLISDGAGGAFITWCQFDESSGHLRMQRVMANGSVVFDPGGMTMGVYFTDDPKHELVMDASGGAIVTWYDSDSGNLCGRGFNSSGSKIWGQNYLTYGISITNIADYPRYLVSDGHGGAIAVVTANSEVKSGDDVIAVRVTSAGGQPWGYTGVALATHGAGSPWDARVAPCATGDGGAVVLWRDDRLEVETLYMQAVNVNGLLGDPCSQNSSAWTNDTENNLKVSEEQNYQFGNQFIADGQGGYLFSWFHASPMRNAGVYAQRLDATGDRMWGADGMILGAVGVSGSSAKMCPDGAGGGIFCWSDYRNGANELFAQDVDASGNPQWTAGGIPVSPSGEDCWCQFVAGDGNGGAYMVWYGGAGEKGPYGLYCQHVNNAGTVLWGLPVYLGTPDAYSPKIEADGSGNALLTWIQEESVTGADIYAQKLDPAGQALWTGGGVIVCGVSGDQYCPRIMADGAGGALILWRDQRSGMGETLYMQRILANGSAAWAAGGVPVSDLCSYIDGHAFTADGAGGAFVTWMSGDDNMMYTGRIDSMGNDVWAGAVQLTNAGYWVTDVADGIHATVSDGISGAIAVFC